MDILLPKGVNSIMKCSFNVSCFVYDL